VREGYIERLVKLIHRHSPLVAATAAAAETSDGGRFENVGVMKTNEQRD
jgi:putative lipoic acid-binding regulatory protein